MTAIAQTTAHAELWPALPLDEWKDTYATLHMWTQIVGKIRMALTPHVNHWWQVPLYVTSRGLSTSAIPYGERTFEITFDFIDHELRIDTSTGPSHAMPLEPRTVASFYGEVMAALRSLGIDVTIRTTPCEVPDPIPFEQDTIHASYDHEYARRLWRILVQSDRVMKAFRARFTGKVSPVHFFWGGFDLAVTRFSGRPAPPHSSVPNIADSITTEAYSHEVSSCGFWPGGFGIDSPIFYAYAYGEPPGFKTYPVQPREAFYHNDFGEFMLPYDAVRASSSPDEMLLAFCQSTYEAAADLAGWDRAALERAAGTA
jgi:Family of unknown function (DUF5996)